ncbi:hypothetical protein, partial [Rhodopirellula bahusiensis]|uniref:hypothetical protein n=1 Tax=Rhodopirellula bahusiensis TaxID=2014065 RepID=UPI0032674736
MQLPSCVTLDVLQQKRRTRRPRKAERADEVDGQVIADHGHSRIYGGINRHPAVLPLLKLEICQW